ncbi:MAG TPA: hypothetical protein VFF06_23595 [Polyangia bacterium]|nr:hypothetical protein [Polyangia bacterium]
MVAIGVLLGAALLGRAALAQPSDGDDCSGADCQPDLSVDECADPAAGCLPEQDLDDAALEQLELSNLPEPIAVESPPAAPLVCPEGTQPSGGHCAADGALATASTGANSAGANSTGANSTGAGGGANLSGGCSESPGGALPSLLVMLLVLAVAHPRARRILPLAALACVLGCVAGGDTGWDAALADGPPAAAAGRFLDVVAGDRADGHGLTLSIAGETAPPSLAPAAQFSLAVARSSGARAILRASSASCGDRLISSDHFPDDKLDGELLGYAASQPAPGTAALTELTAPDGCGAIYETDAEAAALLINDGYLPGAIVGWVWPPGWGAAPPDGSEVESQSLAACNLGAHPALFLFYTGLDHDRNNRLLSGCPGEVALGEKHMIKPLGQFASAQAHAAGGRTALIFGGNGQIFRDLLTRANGVERTAAFIRARLKAGYDYVVVDEVTMDPSWRDGTTVNRRFRQLLGRIPPRTLIAYISLDLTTYAGGAQAMRDRRLLLRALELRGRALALEDYLHTAEVVNGAAPAIFRNAADRVAAAVHDLAGAAGISAREITTLGLSMHTRYPQYNYLDWRAHDLSSITRQVTAIRHGSGRLRAQHGLGFYFIGEGDITPSGTYSVDDVVTRIHQSMLRFR